MPGQGWDRLTGGPRRRQRAMLRRLEELDRLDQQAGGVGLGRPTPAIRSKRRAGRITPLRSLGAGALVVAITVGLIALRMTPTADDAITSVILDGRSRPHRAMPESLTRIKPAPSAPSGQGDYSFMTTNEHGPAAFDPCRSVPFVINYEEPLPNGDAMVQEALDIVGNLSGLRFIVEGHTDELASLDRPPMDKPRYGDRWSPILIAFTNPERDHRLVDAVAGIGGSLAMSDSRGRLTNVSGLVHLDTPALREMLDRPNGRTAVIAIIMHELGHVVGLGHVDDPRELMAAHNSGQTTFGDGDRRGLAELANRHCQFEF